MIFILEDIDAAGAAVKRRRGADHISLHPLSKEATAADATVADSEELQRQIQEAVQAEKRIAQQVQEAMRTEKDREQAEFSVKVCCWPWTLLFAWPAVHALSGGDIADSWSLARCAARLPVPVELCLRGVLAVRCQVATPQTAVLLRCCCLFYSAAAVRRAAYATSNRRALYKAVGWTQNQGQSRHLAGAQCSGIDIRLILVKIVLTTLAVRLKGCLSFAGIPGSGAFTDTKNTGKRGT